MSSTNDPAGTPPPTSLSDMINNATRHQHISLNKLISTRLPLALPPHTTQPNLYTFGLAHLSQIFFAFESLWDELTSTSHLSSLDNSAYGTVDAYPHPHEDALIAGLRTLRPLGLARSKRLQDDLAKLRHVRGVGDGNGGEGRSEVVDRWVGRMEDEVRERPHLLVAYAFTLYLAVLSGGRHIRSELCKAGLGFWTGTTVDEATNEATTEKKASSSWNWRSPVARLTASKKPTPPSTTTTLDSAPHSRKPKSAAELAAFEPNGLSFWFFPGASDGEDLRGKFKANLAELQNYISPSQEDEIVAEAQAIFSRIEALVGELDIAVAAGARASDERSAEDEAMDAALDEVRFEKPQPAAETPLPSPLPVLQDQNALLPVPAWVSLLVVMCGVSYAALVYSNTWYGY